MNGNHDKTQLLQKYSYPFRHHTFYRRQTESHKSKTPIDSPIKETIRHTAATMPKALNSLWKSQYKLKISRFFWVVDKNQD